ncbi:hypothetical protein K1719_016079 [Acacia pycnantha]|nr:hypothetical protein K1719_016079 [Acacia pycnantha]
MTIEGGTTKAACEACRYHKRKCTPECILARYFPAGKSREFQNVHNLFGENKIKKMLNKLEPTVKKDFVESIIYHADMWEMYPAHGCLVKIWDLKRELETVRQELEIYRQHYQPPA